MMTRQRWWDVRRLARIRHGVLMGMYHQAAGFPLRRDDIVFRRDTRMSEITDYERGLVHGYDAVQHKFKTIQP